MCQCFHEVSPTCGNPRRQETPPPSSNGPPLVSGPSYLHWIIVSEFYSLFFYFPYLLVYNYQVAKLRCQMKNTYYTTC